MTLHPPLTNYQTQVTTIHMQCERLIKMIKSWYVHVREETMAPARMVAFMEEHALDCDICRQDPDLKEEIAKITELVLPESKIPKAVRQKNSDVEPDDKEEEETDTSDESEDTVDVDEEDEEELELDIDIPSKTDDV